MRLTDANTGHYYKRSIKADISDDGVTFKNAAWKFLKYILPVSGDTSNGWTKDTAGASINNIDWVEIYVYRTGTDPSGDSTGFAANAAIKFYAPHFWRTYSQSVTSATSPATTKVILNKSLQSQTAQTNYAQYEYNRLSLVNRL